MHVYCFTVMLFVTGSAFAQTESPQPFPLDSSNQPVQPAPTDASVPAPTDVPPVPVLDVPSVIPNNAPTDGMPKVPAPVRDVTIVEPKDIDPKNAAPVATATPFFTPRPSIGAVEDQNIVLGDVKLKLPVTYALIATDGLILGLPYFAMLEGLNYPNFYLLSMQGPEKVEGMAQELFKKNFEGRFTLEATDTISGEPRKIVLTLKGLDTTYLGYVIPMSRPGSFLVALVPLPEGKETIYKGQADSIIKTATF